MGDCGKDDRDKAAEDKNRRCCGQDEQRQTTTWRDKRERLRGKETDYALMPPN